jgi:hypothetical protein
MVMKKNADEFQSQCCKSQNIDIQPDNLPSFADPSWGRLSVTPARIRAVTLGSNFTARIFYQVRFYQSKISSLELVFSIIDLNFRAVY